MSGPTSFDGGTDPVDRVQRGLDLLFAAEVSQELAAAIDVEALRAGDPVDEAVDVAKVGTVLGEPAGRLLVRGAIGSATKGGIAGVLAGELAGRAGARVLRTALERANEEEPHRAFEPTRAKPGSSGTPRWRSSRDPRWLEDEPGIGPAADASGSAAGTDDPVRIEIESPGNDDDRGDDERGDDEEHDGERDDDAGGDNTSVEDEDATGDDA